MESNVDAITFEVTAQTRENATSSLPDVALIGAEEIAAEHQSLVSSTPLLPCATPLLAPVQPASILALRQISSIPDQAFLLQIKFFAFVLHEVKVTKKSITCLEILAGIG
jgi:hypothetical protein